MKIRHQKKILSPGFKRQQNPLKAPHYKIICKTEIAPINIEAAAICMVALAPDDKSCINGVNVVPDLLLLLAVEVALSAGVAAAALDEAAEADASVGEAPPG